MPRPKPTVEKSLTEKEKAYLRLSCIKMVVENGSRIDIKDPCGKAKEYYEFIVGKSFEPTKDKETVKVDTATVEPEPEPEKKKEEKVIEPTQHPFGDSGRKKVLL